MMYVANHVEKGFWNGSVWVKSVDLALQCLSVDTLRAKLPESELSSIQIIDLELGTSVMASEDYDE